MNEQDLRQLVREAVARHLGRGTVSPPDGLTGVPPIGVTGVVSSGVRASAWSGHPSHHLHLTVVNSGEACVIEPSVRCDHCGYCKSHGH